MGGRGGIPRVSMHFEGLHIRGCMCRSVVQRGKEGSFLVRVRDLFLPRGAGWRSRWYECGTLRQTAFQEQNGTPLVTTVSHTDRHEVQYVQASSDAREVSNGTVCDTAFTLVTYRTCARTAKTSRGQP